jgi:HEAT repeat protein
MARWKCSVVIGLVIAFTLSVCSGQGESPGNPNGLTERGGSPSVGKSRLTREVIREVVKKAKGNQPGELMALADSIGKEKDIQTRSDLLPEFEALLTDTQPEAQYLGARGLFALKNPQSRQVLSDFLKGKEKALRASNKFSRTPSAEQSISFWEVRASIFAVKALGEIGDRSVIPLLESLQGIRALQVEWGGWPVQEALVKLGSFKSLTCLKAGEDRLRIQQAVDTIPGIKDANAAPALMAAARDQTVAEEIRVASLSALGGIKAPNVPGFLVKVLDDPNMPTRMRSVATIAAGRTGDSSVEARLKHHAEDPSSAIRADAFIGLLTLQPAAHLDRWFRIVVDVNEVPEFRSRVAGMESCIPRQLLRERKMELYACLSAAHSDGRPFDKIRGDIWMLINQFFQEEPTVVLSTRSGEVARRMRDPIERRIMRANPRLGPADIEKEVDKVLEKLIQVR